MLCACLVSVAAEASAITDVSAQQPQRISLPGEEVTLSELFGEIRRQIGTTVIFDAGGVPPVQKVTLARREGTISELLDAALPKAKYAWRLVGNYIVVRTIPAGPSPAVPSPQPTQEEFERAVGDYTHRNISEPQAETVVSYDTVRVEKPHSGIFDYPGREFTLAPTRGGQTGQTVPTPFSRNTPPFLAVKTNLVWWAVKGTLNIGGEVGLGKRTSLEFSGGNNRWNLRGSDQNNRKLTHWVLKPEFRYWLCERFNGHFFGLHGFYGQYNVGGYDVPLLFKKEYRYEGDAYGAGVNYGYHLAFARRWGVEFTAGAGVARFNYIQSDCLKCGDEVGKVGKTWFSPTELGIKVVFMIK